MLGQSTFEIWDSGLIIQDDYIGKTCTSKAMVGKLGDIPVLYDQVSTPCDFFVGWCIHSSFI